MSIDVQRTETSAPAERYVQDDLVFSFDFGFRLYVRIIQLATNKC